MNFLFDTLVGYKTEFYYPLKQYKNSRSVFQDGYIFLEDYLKTILNCMSWVPLKKESPVFMLIKRVRGVCFDFHYLCFRPHLSTPVKSDIWIAIGYPYAVSIERQGANLKRKYDRTVFFLFDWKLYQRNSEYVLLFFFFRMDTGKIII